MSQYARKYATLVVWKLDRLGRSLRDLIGFLDDLKARGGVTFGSSMETTDTTSAQLFIIVLLIGENND